MATMLAPEGSELDNDAEQSYKVVSKPAIMALILGLASFIALMLPAMLVLPLFGLVSGVVALRSIRLYPDELTGKMPAIIGAALSALLLIGSSTLHATVYLTEVPEGFERRSFDELQPDRQRPDLSIPPSAMEWQGKRVFIKGYVHPGVQGMGPVDKFVLVPDMGTCCFGGQPKLTDMIEVKLVNGASISYSMRKRALAGTFEIDPNIVAPDGSQGACYKLIAEYVK
ncbi:MAG: DUF3299 domain-containing protein [Pirellulales bacterium]|jgi:hypothetical protein